MRRSIRKGSIWFSLLLWGLLGTRANAQTLPHISSFTPASGTLGTTVTITGTGFTGATGVAFHQIASVFAVDSDTQITATVPGGATTGTISVTTPSGTGWSFSGAPFTVDSAGAPTISSFSPGSGAAGWTVTLTGTNFTGTTGVSFNGTPATTMWAISDTQFNAKVPSGATSGPITLTNPAGSAVSTRSFTVTPHISSFTPTSGTMGTTVTITGTGFTGATGVAFHRIASVFKVDSDTQITATVPGGATTGTISVTTPSGTGWSFSGAPFTVDSAGAPTISSFSPGSGAAGWTVTLTGTNFTGTTGVSFNGTPATTMWAISDTQFNAKVPSGATSGPITLSNSIGSAVSAVNFTVNSSGPPTISSFSPGSGYVGWTVTLTGTNFANTTGVSFNGTPATTKWAISDTQYNAKVPSGATSGPITLTNPAGSAVSAGSFTVTPHITSFTPASGTPGTTVTITGTNLTGATTVTFFRVAASFTVDTDTQITATVPSGALSGWISAKTPDGTAWSSSNFTVTSPPPPAALFGHIALVLEENANYSNITSSSMPYLSGLMTQYGLATQYYANTNSSIGNYFMLTTGQILTNNDSETPSSFPVSADNVVRELVAAGKTWKAYAESLPSVGYLGGDTTSGGGQYYVRHVPVAYFTDVQNSSAQQQNLVPFTQFAQDLSSGNLPNYSFITPNGCDDAHDCGLSTADSWLKNNIGPLLSNATFQKDGLLIVVFDQSGSDPTNGGGRVVCALISPAFSKLGYQSTTVYQHQSLLRLTLEGLGVTVLPGAASGAPAMWEFFNTSGGN